MTRTIRPSGWSLSKVALRLVGLALLGWLLARLGVGRVAGVLAQVDPWLAVAAALLLIPQIALKTVRWQLILAAQGIRYPFRLAFSAYLASLLAGLVTPGRVGEFTKMVLVCKECRVSPGLALSGVLADRALDFGTMALVGAVGLVGLGRISAGWLAALLLAALLPAVILPIYMFMDERGYTFLQRTATRLGHLGAKLFSPGGWLAQMRQGLLPLKSRVIVVVFLWTALAYALYFLQAYWLAKSMRLEVSFAAVSFAVALGGLVSLLPISISGLGTREAVFVAYLGRQGIPAEQAVSLSLLIFCASYLFGGLLGALAWWYHPISFSSEPSDSRAGGG